MSSVAARNGSHRWPNESPRPVEVDRIGAPARGWPCWRCQATAGLPGRDAHMKCLRDEMEIVNAYELVGSYRGAAALCGTTAKTVKRVLERRAAGQVGRRPSPARVPNTAAVVELIRQKVRASDWADLRQAAAADGQNGWLRRLDAELPSGGGRSQSELEEAAADLPSVGAVARPIPGDRLGRRSGTQRLVRCAGLESCA